MDLSERLKTGNIPPISGGETDDDSLPIDRLKQLGYQIRDLARLMAGQGRLTEPATLELFKAANDNLQVITGSGRVQLSVGVLSDDKDAGYTLSDFRRTFFPDLDAQLKKKEEQPLPGDVTVDGDFRPVKPFRRMDWI